MRFAVAALAAAVALAAARTLERAKFQFPSLRELVATPFIPQDAALASAGLRAIAADWAWVQLLQYSAGELTDFPDPPGTSYPHLFVLSERVPQLDPSFERAYFFGAGMLAWLHGIDRPDEAVALMEEGIRLHPENRLYSLYIAAIAYKKIGNVPRTTQFLEEIFDDPQTSSLLRAMLANIYKARGDYARALATWKIILDSDRDESEHARARIQIRELQQILARH